MLMGAGAAGFNPYVALNNVCLPRWVGELYANNLG